MIEPCDWSRFPCLHRKGAVEAAYDVRGGLQLSCHMQTGMHSKLWHSTIDGRMFVDHDEPEFVICVCFHHPEHWF